MAPLPETKRNLDPSFRRKLTGRRSQVKNRQLKDFSAIGPSIVRRKSPLVPDMDQQTLIQTHLTLIRRRVMILTGRERRIPVTPAHRYLVTLVVKIIRPSKTAHQRTKTEYMLKQTGFHRQLTETRCPRTAFLRRRTG